ncbi:hypothetical protein K435DRAFT_797359 [Dendrothele bispora CBS 962.96]|uniref:Uncharacterized protein n=1 Tax=Dendrothele bispora (strain CBS 962.96) TaxID=1314807 RepID=A0A4V4HFV1_DENBC|nr:hypothetical protein K435DRAFT_797359 [Dendrothele bispora CBS 962.96]
MSKIVDSRLDRTSSHILLERLPVLELELRDRINMATVSASVLTKGQGNCVVGTTSMGTQIRVIAKAMVGLLNKGVDLVRHALSGSTRDKVEREIRLLGLVSISLTKTWKYSEQIGLRVNCERDLTSFGVVYRWFLSDTSPDSQAHQHLIPDSERREEEGLSNSNAMPHSSGNGAVSSGIFWESLPRRSNPQFRGENTLLEKYADENSANSEAEKRLVGKVDSLIIPCLAVCLYVPSHGVNSSGFRCNIRYQRRSTCLWFRVQVPDEACTSSRAQAASPNFAELVVLPGAIEVVVTHRVQNVGEVFTIRPVLGYNRVPVRDR